MNFEIATCDQRLTEAVLLAGDGWHTVDEGSFRFMPGVMAEWREKQHTVLCSPSAVIAVRLRAKGRE